MISIAASDRKLDRILSFALHLEAQVKPNGRARGQMTEADLQEAMVYLRARLEGMTEEDYAHAFPASYQQLRRAVGKE